ncbi:hypothetical protein CGLO_09020 [Colletotrichum gloeosporioides Cg-14]|uniref:Uncharacterized protein n=1 Tax=Colletotrichum gloeosporioides (strain Cg-14) TaxID=1237896 RepID=T0LTA4_COLGC|nr:hypothetical protein CGLO_09020 [Colletotrichum gloeosporioides Cg-14]
MEHATANPPLHIDIPHINMSQSNLNPGNLSLMEKSMMIDGFAFTIHLETKHKNLAKHLIDTGHRAVFRFVFLDPDHRPFHTRKEKFAARLTSIIRAALTNIHAYGLEPKDVEKPGFWPMARKLLTNVPIFASATNEETREWKYLVELYYAAWLKYAEDHPHSTKGFVASPVGTNFVFWDLHLAIADWNAVMGGNFRATVDVKGFEILEERKHKAAAAQYYAQLEGDKRFKDAHLANWSSGWDMCIQMMMSRSENVLEQEREMMRRSAMDNIGRDRQIDELKARLAHHEEILANEDAGAVPFDDGSPAKDKAVTAVKGKLQNAEGHTEENDVAIKTESTASHHTVAQKSPEKSPETSPETKGADNDADNDVDNDVDNDDFNDSKSVRGETEVIDLTVD